MAAQKHFKGTIWTNHALDRLKERGIKQGDAWTVWRNPDKSRYAASKGAWIYYKTWGDQRIEVVAKQNEKKEWIILSAWSKKLHKPTKQQTSSKSIIKFIKNLFS